MGGWGVCVWVGVGGCGGGVGGGWECARARTHTSYTFWQCWMRMWGIVPRVET